jgi:predicted secreted acid phosphatase
MLKRPNLFKFITVMAASAVIAGGTTASATPDEHTQAMQEPANLGKLKIEIKAYYGDYRDANGHHHHSDSSAWSADTEEQINEARAYLAQRLREGVRNPGIVLDIDDTSEITFGWNADNDFGFDRAKQDQAIKDGVFPAITPTLEFANWAADNGVKVYFVTGRKPYQADDTLKNLANEGYPAPAGAYFKPTTDAPVYLPCKLKCTMAEFKAYTRAHIESRGVKIVVNVGDQDSDLQYGHADLHVKLPNPTYYVP